MNEIKREDEIYCPECAKHIKKNAVVCINCGVKNLPTEKNVS